LIMGEGMEERALDEEIHHSRLGEVSMQRFDLSTKRYLFDNNGCTFIHQFKGGRVG